MCLIVRCVVCVLCCCAAVVVFRCDGAVSG